MMKTNNIDEINVNCTVDQDINKELIDKEKEVVLVNTVGETATNLPKHTSQSCSDLFDDEDTDRNIAHDDELMGKEN